MTTRSQKLRVVARSGHVWVYGDLYVGSNDLTADEHKKVVGRVIRGVPEMLKNVPYADFGIDNITTRRMRGRS